MYIPRIIELIYLSLIFTYIVFIAVFYLTTSSGGSVETDGGTEEHSRGMDASEKKWLAILITIAIIGNIILLSPLVPSAKMNIWSAESPVKTVVITIEDYEFILPENPIVVEVGKPIEFIVRSNDVTYGFGVFREDGTMVFQMQVLPNYDNRIVWVFDEPGKYTIRSTEYSGPKHPYMVVYDAIVVRGGVDGA